MAYHADNVNPNGIEQQDLVRSIDPPGYYEGLAFNIVLNKKNRAGHVGYCDVLRVDGRVFSGVLLRNLQRK